LNSANIGSADFHQPFLDTISHNNHACGNSNVPLNRAWAKQFLILSDTTTLPSESHKKSASVRDGIAMLLGNGLVPDLPIS
jgi:hypothetical protein